VMLFTDANLNQGTVDPHIVSDIGKAMDQDGIHLTGVGVGIDFRDDVLNRLTEKGKGAYVFLSSEAVVDRLFGHGFDALVQVIAEDVQFQLQLPPSLGLERFYGEEISTRKKDVQTVNFHAGTSQLFLQDLAIRDAQVVSSDAIRLNMSWTDPASGQPMVQTYSTTVGRALSSGARNASKGLALQAWTEVLTARALGADTCGEARSTFDYWTDQVGPDAELAWAASQLPSDCPELRPVPVPYPAPVNAPVEAKIRVDSDAPVTAVSLSCQGDRQTRRLTQGENVARLTGQPGWCDVALDGVVPMVARVQLPRTDVDLRCVVRAGRMQCD